jgi:hypothetical protein
MIFDDLLAYFTTLKGVGIITYFQIHSILTNKAKVKYAKININSMITMRYEKMDIWLLGKTNPIQSQYKPKQTQLKPISMPIKANTNPNKANFKRETYSLTE